MDWTQYDPTSFVETVFRNPPPELKKILDDISNKKFPDYFLPSKPWTKDENAVHYDFDSQPWRRGSFNILMFQPNTELSLTEAFAWGWRVAKDTRKDVWIPGVDQEVSDEKAAQKGLEAVKALLEAINLENAQKQLNLQKLELAKQSFELKPEAKLKFYTEVVGRLARENKITRDQGVDLRHVFVLSVDNPQLTGDYAAEREGSFLNRLEDVNKVSFYLIGKLSPQEILLYEEAVSEIVFGRLVQWNFGDPQMIATMFRKLSPWAEKHPRYQELVNWAKFNATHAKNMLDPKYAADWAKTADQGALMEQDVEMLNLGQEVQIFAYESFLNEWRDKLLDPKYKQANAQFDVRIKQLHELYKTDPNAFNALNLSEEDLKQVAAYDLVVSSNGEASLNTGKNKSLFPLILIMGYLLLRRKK